MLSAQFNTPIPLTFQRTPAKLYMEATNSSTLCTESRIECNSPKSSTEASSLCSDQLTDDKRNLGLSQASHFRAGFRQSTTIVECRKNLQQYIQDFPSVYKQSNYRSTQITENSASQSSDFLTKRVFINEVAEDLLIQPERMIRYIEKVNTQKLFGEFSKTSKQSMKIKQRANMQSVMIEKLEIQQIITCSQIPMRISEKINQKYILFLKGKYRALKCFNSQDQTRYSSKLLSTIREFLGNLYKPSQQFHSQMQPLSDSLLNSENDELAYSNMQLLPCNRKQIFHNLSKYMMHLILELLSDDHLNEFGIAAGYQPILSSVIQRLRESGKRNQFSQTFYFNHSHYNTFFLVVTEQNKDKLRNMPDFMKIQNKVFGEIDFDDTRAVLNLNILKHCIGRIVQMQIRHVLDQIDQVFGSQLFELNNIQTDCQAKGFYLKSVHDGISKLLNGQYLIRF